jgi:acyl-CoA hydrolase
MSAADGVEEESPKYAWEEGETRPTVPRPEPSIIAELVGHAAVHGQKLGLGPLLALADLAAGRCAWSFTRTPVATVAFDSCAVLSTARHGELVRFRACIVSVGRSSVRVEVLAERHLGRQHYKNAVRVFVTMVALTPQGKPNYRIPALMEYPTEEGRSRPQTLTAEQLEGVPDPATPRSGGEAVVPERDEYIPSSKSALTLRRIFLPRHLNVNSTIFGGDLLLWMDRHAVYVAQSFSSARSAVFSVGMAAVEFSRPITTRDTVEMVGQVVYAHHDDMVVQLLLTIENREGERSSSHNAWFIVRVNDEIGLRVGVERPESGSETLAQYESGRARYLQFQEQQAREERRK